MRSTLERVASNEALFAEANDAIAAFAGSLPPRALVPFLCECPDARCTEVVELSLGEYAVVRLYADRFVVATQCSSGELAGTVIVETTDRYRLVDRPAPA